MKRSYALLLILLLALLTGCGKSTSAKSDDSKANKRSNSPTPDGATVTTQPDNGNGTWNGRTYTPAEIEAAIANVIGDGYNATVDVPLEEMYSCALADADFTKIESYVAKLTLVPSVQQDQVVIATAADAAYADELVKLYNKEYERSILYAKQYPMEPHKLTRARIYKIGNTVMYIIAGRSAEPRMDDSECIALAEAEYRKIDDMIRDFYGYLPENLLVEPEPVDNGESHASIDGDIPFDEEIPFDDEIPFDEGTDTPEVPGDAEPTQPIFQGC